MNKPEVIKLIALCSANYRNWPADGKEEDIAMLWEMMLSDIPFSVGLAAVKTHLSRSPYPPTIADIRDAAAKITSPPSTDAIVAWDMIGQAIRKYGYYKAEEALASLPDDVADMARRFTWRELCLSENIDTLRAQFRMAWETMEKHRKEERLMPPDVLIMIESTGALKRLS